MSYTIETHIINWWNSLTPKYRSKLCNKYLGFKTYTKSNDGWSIYSEQLLKNYQIEEIYKKNFNIQLNLTNNANTKQS